MPHKALWRASGQRAPRYKGVIHYGTQLRFCPLGTLILQMFACGLESVQSGPKAWTCSKCHWCIICEQTGTPNERAFLDRNRSSDYSETFVPCCTVSRWWASPEIRRCLLSVAILHRMSAEWSLSLLAVWRQMSPRVWRRVFTRLPTEVTGFSELSLYMYHIDTASCSTRQAHPKLPRENFEISYGTICLEQ